MTLTHHHLAARFGQTRSLVVLLHGFRSNGVAMLGLGKTLFITLLNIAFQAPDAQNLVLRRAGGRTS